MPKSVILVDFGASRVKAVRWSLSNDCVIASRECAAPELRFGRFGEAEGDPEAYWRALEVTAGQLIEVGNEIADLWLCSEMHGFMLADPATGVPLTPYISWQDQRACHKNEGRQSTIERLAPIGDMLMKQAGMRLRPGLPVTNLAHLQVHGVLATPARFLTLVDWLLLRGGQATPRCHRTLAAGTGLYSLADGAWSVELMLAAGIDPAKLQMPIICDDDCLIGAINLNGRAVRVFGGLGDLQAAAHGAGFPHTSSILVNLGTGSQVLAVVPERVENIELRPCAGDELAQAVTHIPSGRAMNEYARFIDGCSRLGGGQPIFWKMFASLAAEEVLAAEDCVDLNVFEAAWRYSSGGSIRHILENNFDLQWLMRSIAKSWLVQYAQALTAITETHPSQTFLLGGGLSRRSAFVQPVLKSLLGRKPVCTVLRTGEETLDGLLMLAEHFSTNNAPSQ